MSDQTNLWTEKYRPKTFEEYIGGAGNIKKIKQWFQEFRNIQNGKNSNCNNDNGNDDENDDNDDNGEDGNVVVGKSKSKNKNKEKKKKILLFVGPSSTGKTTLAYIAFKEENYNILEYNCTNITDIKDMREIVGKASSHANILDLFQGKIKPAGLILDEIDNISNGITEFVNMIKGDDIKSPIICTCNDPSSRGIKNLRPYCEEIKFTKPTKFEMEQLIKEICEKEDIKLELDTYYLIIEKAQSDWRILISLLQSLKSSYGSLEIDREKVINGMKYLEKKDLNLHLYEVVNRVFNKKMNLEESINMYMTDCSMVPLLLQQNYPKAVIFKKNSAKDLVKKMANISSDLAFYDIIATDIYQSQDWGLTKYMAVHSTAFMNYYLNSYPELEAHPEAKKKLAAKNKYFEVESSSLLNKISQHRRNIKLINNLPLVLKTNLSYDDLFILSEIFVYHLFEKNGNKIGVIKIMKEIGFELEDENKVFTLEALVNILAINPSKNKKITSKLKTDLQNIYENL